MGTSLAARLLVPTGLLVGLLAAAPETASALEDPTYAALRAARPDGRRVAVENLVVERDVLRFQFDAGAFHWLSPVDGRTVGGVFLGAGSYRLTPATESERRHLALVTGEEGLEVLSDSFDALVLLFVDETAGEIEGQRGVTAGPPDPRAVAVWEKHLERQRKEFRTNFHLRLLQDLLNVPGLTNGVFMAFVNGKRFPPALAWVDYMGNAALRLVPTASGEDTALYVVDPTRGGLWYLSHRRLEVETGRSSPLRHLTDAHHYTVETEVLKNDDIRGTTSIRFQPRMSGIRVVPVELWSRLRLREASFALATAGGEGTDWRPLPFVQEAKDEDADAAVVLPEPLAGGAEVLLRLSYEGEDVLSDAGDGNFVVSARTSWYPNLGTLSDLATYELTYRVPAKNQVVSVGKLVESREEGAHNVSVWRADRPVRVAGFNYGRFKLLERKDEETGLLLKVYTNPGTPDIIREIDSVILRSQGLRESSDGTTVIPSETLGPTIGQVNTERLAESALADAANAARVASVYFGPLVQEHVAITQQSQWSFGQSWPSLIFLPYVAFMHGGLRAQLGLNLPGEELESLGYHELAHQWWGHQLGWDSFRDQWLSEGFAEFTSALVIHHVQGWQGYDEFWRKARESILDKPPGNAVANYQAGPLTQGWRLANHRSPSAYGAVVYSKGGFVLHMLRMLMREPAQPTPDAAFIAMMKDFVGRYAGKSPSTADFQKVVEAHMVPAMNATGDGKMDWFFRQWVYGTDLPRYSHDLAVEPVGKDLYRVRGKVTQSGVPADFRMLVPVYLDFGKVGLHRLGVLTLVGSSEQGVDVTVKLPKKPRKVVLNAHYEVLALD